MIEVRNVTKTFDKFKALDNLTLTVQKGAVYGLIGPNGAGKTTILKTIAGIYKQTDGDVLVMGEKIFENASVKSKTVFISDDLYFFTTYSILDTAKFYAKTYPLWSWERFESLKDIFKIDVNRKVRRLSKGMQKQVAFWLAVCARPEILLLDEPVDGLDPVMRRNVWRLMLSDVAENNTTVLVSSHNLRELEDVCDHVGIMHQGKLILEKALDDMKGSAHKIQVAFDAEIPVELKNSLNILHEEKFGSVNILIVQGQTEEITQEIEKYSPKILDILPLTLEEIFIYELGGKGYEFENIIL